MKIVTVTADTFEKVLPLIGKYQVFYKAQPDEEKNRKFFSQFLDDHSRGILFVALDEEERAIGFATLYFTFSSVSAGPLCILNDLFVETDQRRGGIRSLGNKLIVHAFNYAVANGYPKVCGTTDESNHTAQRLYNSLLDRYQQYKVTKSVLFEYCAVYTHEAGPVAE